MQSEHLNVRRRLITLAASAAICAGAGTAMAQPTYRLTDLAPVASCGATFIGDTGAVLGNCNDTAVVWNSGIPTSLGRLSGGTYSTATAMNGKGLIIGEGDTGNGRPQSWVMTANGPYNFFPNNGGNTHAVFVGNNGFIGGYYTKSLSGNTSSWKGAIWTPDPKDARKYRTFDLPVLAGGTDPKSQASIPAAFNQLGQAAGYAVNNAIGQHAVFWQSDAAHTIVDLGVYPGDWTSLAWGMNDLGQVVGESHPPFGSRPVLWNNDAAHSAVALPLLPGDNYGSADQINNLGHVLGSSTYVVPGTWDAVGPSHAVLWRDGQVYDVQSIVDPESGAGWTITWAAALNNAGQILAYGVHNGEVRIVILTPIE